jgi:hypothetical protein
MNQEKPPSVANSVSDFLEWALRTQKRWRDQHRDEANRSRKREKQWDDDAPFWKPWFRGQTDESWRLTPKLYHMTETKTSKLLVFEEEMRAEFKRRGPQLASGFQIPNGDDEWGWYSLMRHYGAPTRLLDWTDGALIGLYFAVRPSEISDKAACVWMLDPYRLNLLSFRHSDDSVGVALPDWEAAQAYVPELFVSAKLRRAKPLAVTPPHIFPRLSSQRSHFTVFGTRRDGLEELSKDNGFLLETITVPRASIEKIVSELELCGVSDATIFPDLEGLSRELDAASRLLFGGSA